MINILLVFLLLSISEGYVRTKRFNAVHVKKIRLSCSREDQVIDRRGGFIITKQRLLTNAQR